MSSYSVDYEPNSPHPFSQADAVEAHNFGQPDTPHAVFGNFVRDLTRANSGTACGRSDLIRYTKGVPYQRCENKKNRPGNNGLGTHEYFCYAFQFDHTSFSGAAHVICQPNWPSFAPPGISLRLNPNHITLVAATGIIHPTSPVYQYNCDADDMANKYVNLPPMYARPPGLPIETGVWHHIILHAFWADNSSGVVETWHRIKGGSFVKTASLVNIATLQIQNGKVQPGVEDKWGPYRNTSPVASSMWYDSIGKYPTLALAMNNSGKW